MTNTTVHPSLSAIDTLESLAAHALQSPAPDESADYRQFDSMNVIANCEAIIAIQKQFIDDWNYAPDDMAKARRAAIIRLLTDLYYPQAAKHITT